MKIETNIPIPTHVGRGSPRKWPFYSMQPGESVLVTPNGGVGTTLCRIKSKQGWKFCTRTEGDKLRVWRIE